MRTQREHVLRKWGGLGLGNLPPLWRLLAGRPPRDVPLTGARVHRKVVYASWRFTPSQQNEGVLGKRVEARHFAGKSESLKRFVRV